MRGLLRIFVTWPTYSSGEYSPLSHATLTYFRFRFT